ncbi:MAG: 50S ribosomal protein L18 [Bacteroidota bacterium]
MRNVSQKRRLRIRKHIAKKVRGTQERPRLSVYRSLNHIYVQIVDDSQAKTLMSTSTLAKDLRDELKELKDRKALAKKVGVSIAKKAAEKNIKKVVFDRSGYMYHGIVKALADGAREGGLEF